MFQLKVIVALKVITIKIQWIKIMTVENMYNHVNSFFNKDLHVTTTPMV